MYWARNFSIYEAPPLMRRHSSRCFFSVRARLQNVQKSAAKPSCTKPTMASMKKIALLTPSCCGPVAPKHTGQASAAGAARIKIEIASARFISKLLQLSEHTHTVGHEDDA